jgi:hypothetical protein
MEDRFFIYGHLSANKTPKTPCRRTSPMVISGNNQGSKENPGFYRAKSAIWPEFMQLQGLSTDCGPGH